MEKITNKETWEQVKKILTSSGKLETLYFAFVIPTPLKNKLGLEGTEPKTSKMEIDSEHVPKEARIESSQGSDIIIQEKTEEVEGQGVPL